MRDDFAAFILTHGRPDRVVTYNTLRRCGYTGRIVLLVDDLDKTGDEYKKKFGSEVYIFDKKAIAQKFDQGDNFSDMRSIVYARNASFEAAEALGIKYFIQLDDDYTTFTYRFKESYSTKTLRKLDKILEIMLNYYIATPRIHSLAMAQGGDFIGGDGSQNAKHRKLLRKCMNSFICSTDRKFTFLGRINEDVNTYTYLASLGHLFLTTNAVSLAQNPTQTNSGGMTDIYQANGTYVKSFYTVIFQPSSVQIGVIRGQTGRRLHHRINWKKTVPKILRESWRKS